ncbi:MAG: hypothetical protein ABJP48_06695 [Erythrobacter sp.]
MARSGYGFGGISRLPQSSLTQELTVIAPGSTWDGAAGSGFTDIPQDPVRVTAKPILRMITVPRQRFGSRQLVGVRAAANNGGSLFDSEGLSHVRVYYEGNTIDIPSPSLQIIREADGLSRCYWGWWCELEYSGDGASEVYFEAVPLDVSIQNRVIGPFRFFPNSADWDFDISVDSQASEVVGQSYQNLNTAVAWLKSQGATGQCRVKILTAGDVNFTNRNWNRGAGAGWLVVEAMVPGVRFIQARNTNGLTTFFRPKCEPICYRNCEFDFAGSSEYLFEASYNGGAGIENWFDGCTFTNSNGREDLVRGRPRNIIFTTFRGSHWFTAGSYSNLWNCAVQHQLVRGCQFTSCWSDLANGTSAFIGNTVQDFDGRHFREGIAALRVSYDGPDASATIRASGATTKTITLQQNSTDIGIFIVRDTNTAFLEDTNYSIQHVADWINSFPDWSATLLDNSLAAFSLSTETGSPQTGFSAQDVKTAPIDLWARFDIHADVYQVGDNASPENIAICENQLWDINAQTFFLSGVSHKDFLMVNNAVQNEIPVGDRSQFSGEHSHIVFAHNSLATQPMLLRSDNGQDYDPDPYCLISANSLTGLEWTGEVDADLIVDTNHIHSDEIAPEGSIGTTIGGDETSLYGNAANGDFAPSGQLLSQGTTAIILRDLNCARRSTFGAIGAIGKTLF